MTTGDLKPAVLAKWGPKIRWGLYHEVEKMYKATRAKAEVTRQYCVYACVDNLCWNGKGKTVQEAWDNLVKAVPASKTEDL